MVINNLHLERMPIMPFEADSPLIVNPNAPLPSSITGQPFKSIRWWDPQIHNIRRAMQHP
jgi:hypothetical protein